MLILLSQFIDIILEDLQNADPLVYIGIANVKPMRCEWI